MGTRRQRRGLLAETPSFLVIAAGRLIRVSKQGAGFKQTGRLQLSAELGAAKTTARTRQILTKQSLGGTSSESTPTRKNRDAYRLYTTL